MARSVAARGKLALAFWMLFGFRGLAHCEGSVEVFGTIDLGFLHETGNTTDPVNKITSGVESGSRLGFKGRQELNDEQPNGNSRGAGRGASLRCVSRLLQFRSAYFKRNSLTPGVDTASGTVLAANYAFKALQIYAAAERSRGPGSDPFHRDRTPWNKDASQFAMGYTDALSKRTEQHSSVGGNLNRNGAGFTVGNAGEIAYGSGNRAFNFGARPL